MRGGGLEIESFMGNACSWNIFTMASLKMALGSEHTLELRGSLKGVI